MPQSDLGFSSGRISALLVAEVCVVPAWVNLDLLWSETVSLLEEYFSGLSLYKAWQRVKKLEFPAYHHQVVTQAMLIGLCQRPPHVVPIARLLEYLFLKGSLTSGNLVARFSKFASVLDYITGHFQKATADFGQIIGRLVLAGVLDFKVVLEILIRLPDNHVLDDLFSATMVFISSNP